MIGFSLPSRLFRVNPSERTEDALLHAYGRNMKLLLTGLKEAGIASIELRMLPRHVDSTLYEEVIRMIWESGLQLTVHGGLEGEESADSFKEIYPSMDYILEHFQKYQDHLMITVHALHDREAPERNIEVTTRDLSERTSARLQQWAMMLDAEKRPIQLALEINRRKSPIIDPGDHCDGVVQMVKEANRSNIGICWDMGHYYSNLVTQSGLKDVPENWIGEMPSPDFIHRVVHTHIHGLFGRTGTHFPLSNANSLPLENYVDALRKSGYQGVFNLELTWDKWARDSVREQALTTIRRLSEAVRSNMYGGGRRIDFNE